MGNLVRATIETDEYGNVWYVCHKCGYRWQPRKVNPVECPACKTHLIVTEDMQEKIKKKVTPDEIQDVKEIVPDMFIAQCSECEQDAVAKFKGKMYCEVHLLKAMKNKGLLKDV